MSRFSTFYTHTHAYVRGTMEDMKYNSRTTNNDDGWRQRSDDYWKPRITRNSKAAAVGKLTQYPKKLQSTLEKIIKWQIKRIVLYKLCVIFLRLPHLHGFLSESWRFSTFKAEVSVTIINQWRMTKEKK